MDWLLAALSPSPSRLFSASKDLSIMKRAVSSIIDATEEAILTENEAEALINFLATKFVEHRFGAVLESVFDVGSPSRYTLRALQGTLK
jgi:hypothetical protein